MGMVGADLRIRYLSVFEKYNYFNKLRMAATVLLPLLRRNRDHKTMRKSKRHGHD
jgi:hypothetical protein